jgi:leucyl-tRNA synthetase
MGYDAFGLPAEQYAIEHGVPPRETTEKNIANIRNQFRRLGNGYDWDREIATTDVNYYKWTQWIFLQLYNSWYDEEQNKARPISELVHELEQEHVVVNFDGKLMRPKGSGMQEWFGTEPGVMTWSEMNPRQRRDLLARYRLAYMDEIPVNWCPALGTVLANEEVTNEGRSDRGNHPVYRRPLLQWMLRITAYADRLENELDLVDWPEPIKLMQQNWIGRSEGAEVDFALADQSGETIRVYTTRPDTLFGATYMVLAPEHPLVKQITTDERKKEVEEYVATAANKSEMDRTAETKEKTGVFTGAYAINPVNEEKIPVWVADYVMMSYGTGAIMAVPAHDTRDFEFAEKYNLPIIQVVQPPGNEDWRGFVGEGVAVNSGKFDGLPTAEFKKQITGWLEENACGYGAVNYKLRDWLFSRQRYWGEPFPIVHEKKTGEVYPLDENELPVTLPEISDYRPQGSDDPEAPPSPPLGRSKEWVNVRGYITDEGKVKVLTDNDQSPEDREVRDFVREMNTMPQWAGSCWYYLRYLDPQNDQAMVQPDVEKYWMTPNGVDLYVGGAEHAVLHLLYARFWHKVLYDLGYVSSPEPFGRLFNQGYIQAYAYQDERGMYVDVHDVEERKEGKKIVALQKSTGAELNRNLGKMGKSLKNAVSPDEICEEFGADTLRAYEMYMGPLEASKPWSTRDIIGMSRFMQNVWKRFVADDGSLRISEEPPDDASLRLMHKTIKRVTEDMAGLRFNTAIAGLIEMNNALKGDRISWQVAEAFLKLLSPIAPHICEELWQRMHGEKWQRSLALEDWPTYKEELCVDPEVEIPVQVNGKVRSRITMPAAAAQDQEEMQKLAQADEKVEAALTGKTVHKIICIPGRMVNIVAK